MHKCSIDLLKWKRLSEALIIKFVLYASVTTFFLSKCVQQLRVNFFMFCHVCLSSVYSSKSHNAAQEGR